MQRLITAIVCGLAFVSLSGCSAPTRARVTDSVSGNRTTSTTPTEDPNKFTCKKLCKQTQGCPVSSAHCKKEREPAVCWSFYYTDKSRQKSCYHRHNNQKECPEDFPVYCNPETEEVLPDFIPPPSIVKKTVVEVNLTKLTEQKILW